METSRREILNAQDDGRVASAVLAGYGKFAISTIMRNFNGATAVKDICNERPEGKGWVFNEEERYWYRIRKLTPRECFRLMGVREKSIDLIQNARFSKDSLVATDDGKPLSETQQYKMAGNSIVVDVLYAIFKNIFAPSKEEMDEYGQMTLF